MEGLKYNKINIFLLLFVFLNEADIVKRNLVVYVVNSDYCGLFFYLKNGD